MKKKILTTGTILLLAGGPIMAADGASASRQGQNLSYDQSSGDLFRAHELSVDIFGTDTLGQHTIKHPAADRIRNNSVLGAGVGLNYFVTRYVGVGGDAYTENTAHSFVDNASGNLIVRLPFDGIGLAPYAFGGGGYKFDPVSTSFGQFGAGLEFRFHHNVGVFVEGRYVVANRIRDYGVARAGVRIAF